MPGLQPARTTRTGIRSFSDLHIDKPKGFYATNSIFHYKTPSSLPVLEQKTLPTPKGSVPSFLPTHPSLTKDHNPTYFHLPIGITPPASTLCSLHPPRSFQTPLSTKTTMLEAPKLTKSFQPFLSCLVSPAE